MMSENPLVQSQLTVYNMPDTNGPGKMMDMPGTNGPGKLIDGVYACEENDSDGFCI